MKRIRCNERVIALHRNTSERKQLALIQFELAERYTSRKRYKEAQALYSKALPYLEDNYKVTAEWRLKEVGEKAKR